MASDKAFRDEEAAYNALKKKLGSTAVTFQEPAGADAGFPDFGFTLSLPMGKVDLHIEYKNSSTAQMGSMRDWIFNGFLWITLGSFGIASIDKYITTNKKSNNTEEITE